METTETSAPKNNTPLILLLIICLIGAISIISLILAFTIDDSSNDSGEIIVEGYQPQANEAISMLETLKELMLDERKIQQKDHIYLINSLKEGETLIDFAMKFNMFLEDLEPLEYYQNQDFVFHKGGGRNNNGVEFYIEVKSSLKHATNRREEINQNLCIRLYSDGSIERSN